MTRARLALPFALVGVFSTSVTLPQEEIRVSREDVERYERELLSAPPDEPAALERRDDDTYSPEIVEVELPDRRKLPAIVLVPPDYDPARRFPLLLAMHGGPVGSPRDAFDGAVRMLSLWHRAAGEAGWIVVSPAMTHVVARGPRTETRLPYEILRTEQMEAILAEVGRHYAVDYDHVVSTGISLGSNFSIAYAASRPSRFAAIVPVSTEGESRERLLRNLIATPTYVLEGALDPNIRAIDGPRAMHRIQSRLGHDVVYRELADRGHEGFAELYPEVLEWLASRRRDSYPREVWRVPHDGIAPLDRRVHWIESDTRRGLLHARVVDDTTIEVEARWARRLRLFLTDRLVSLDEPVVVRINGEEVHRGRVERSLEGAREDQRRTRDPGRVFAAALAIEVPETPANRAYRRRFSERVEPKQPPEALSFWESYALQSLVDRLPSLGIEGRLVSVVSATDFAALAVDGLREGSPLHDAGLRTGDVLLEVGGEPFYPDRGIGALEAWLARELTEEPRELPLLIEREGTRMTLRARLALDPF